MDLAFEVGDDGVADPLGSVGPGAARAGRIDAADLPDSDGGLAVWSPGDFVLANDRVAMVVEDIGPSDLYDPWGGRPVGITQVQDGALVAPNNFGEFFVLLGRQTVFTTSVSVINDGTDGQPAVIRASGMPKALPFYENLVGPLLRADYSDIPTAIEYELAPDADHVDIYMVYNSPRLEDTEVSVVLHGFMYTNRSPTFAPGLGFATAGEELPMLGFIDDDATSYGYSIPGEDLGVGISASGFTSNFADPFDIPACAQTRRHYARITIGGPGVDGLLQAAARVEGQTLRAISGTVNDASGAPLAGVRVHATEVGATSDGYLTRAMSDQTGAFRLHVPESSEVELTTWRRGHEVVGPVAVGSASEGIQLTVPDTGLVHVQTVDDDSSQPLPVRIQLLPVGQSVPELPGHYGETTAGNGRLHVEFAMDGETTMRAPPGEWEVIVSRGYEYDIHREVVTVVANQTVDVQARLAHVVDTTGQQCADFHIHTHRSADSGDRARMTLMSAVADGLEIPVRTDHEYVDDFQPLIEELGLEAWAYGVRSIEMTSFQTWGHMGVFPLREDPTAVNGGAPRWQRYPTLEQPEVPVETLLPPEVFGQIRARPEQPAIIINHPRGSTNYFTISGYDAATGEVRFPQYWDDQFRLVEVFNSSSWPSRRDSTVADWLSFLDQGRRVFAVGSSDTHGVRGKPVGYARTCLYLGTDDPRQLTPESIRDATQEGRSSISGGIYMHASVAGAGPGQDAVGVPASTQVSVRVEAPSWIAVDWVEVVVDGEVVDTIAVLPGDADPGNPAIRYQSDIDIQVAPGAGSYVIVAAWGDSNLDPVHPGRQPFAVSNPIFLTQ